MDIPASDCVAMNVTLCPAFQISEKYDKMVNADVYVSIRYTGKKMEVNV